MDNTRQCEMLHENTGHPKLNRKYTLPKTVNRKLLRNRKLKMRQEVYTVLTDTGAAGVPQLATYL